MSVDAVQSKVADIADLDGDGKVDEKDLELAKAIAVERAEETKKMALAAYALAAEKGFFSHFSEYNDEILNPIKHAKEGDFSVESDREVMKLLQKLAELITVRLERGNMDSLASEEPKAQPKPMNPALHRKLSRQFSLSEHVD